MESITKNRQSLSTLREIVARAFGREQVRDDDDFAEELGHGWFNVAHRIGLRDGRDVVLKIAPPADVAVMTYEHEMMRNELDAIALIQEHTQVTVPHIDFVDTSRELVDAPYFVMAFIDAENIGAASAYLRGYGRGRLTAVERQRRELYSLYLFLVMAIETSYRGHEDTSQYDFAISMLRTLLDDGDRAD